MIRQRSEISDDVLRESYARLGNVWKVGEELGMAGQTAYRRLCRLGANKPMNKFTPAEAAHLLLVYDAHLKNGTLAELAKEFGRTRPFLCRQARALGLTDARRAHTSAQRKATSARIKKWMKENEHPRGFLGGKHSEETKRILSRRSKEMWVRGGEPMKEAMAMRVSHDNKMRGAALGNRAKASWKAAWREIGGKRCYFRSAWEANYARYLEWLKSLKQIAEWEHEPKTFWFEGIKRGTMSYLPDFRVTENSGAEIYHEVKGWMDARSKTTIARMGRYHPDVKLIVIDAKGYKAIARKVDGLIPGWEKPVTISEARAV